MLMKYNAIGRTEYFTKPIGENASATTTTFGKVTDLLAAWLRSGSKVLELGESASWTVLAKDPGTIPASHE